jgi:hypothetical protein
MALLLFSPQMGDGGVRMRYLQMISIGPGSKRAIVTPMRTKRYVYVYPKPDLVSVGGAIERRSYED